MPRRTVLSPAEKRRRDLFRVANSAAMRSAVFNAVVHERGKGARKIKKAIGITTRTKYPRIKRGDAAKVPRESYQGWGHIPMVRKAIGNPHIPGKIIKEALYERSAKAYEREWAAAAKPSKKAPAKMTC